MREDICSIPISQVFETRAGCPICRMRDMLEERMLEYIMGAAMMEPDVRMETNRLGFCQQHFFMMLKRRNRLSVALMMDSYLKEQEKELFPKKLPLVKTDYKKQADKIGKQLDSCFVCDKISWSMDRLLSNMMRLYVKERDFRALFDNQPCLCLPHYRLLLETGKKEMDKKYFGDFAAVCEKLAHEYMTALCQDVSHFCTMFDYRNTGEDADWGNSKDSIERCGWFLTSRQP